MATNTEYVSLNVNPCYISHNNNVNEKWRNGPEENKKGERITYSYLDESLIFFHTSDTSENSNLDECVLDVIKSVFLKMSPPKACA